MALHEYITYEMIKHSHIKQFDIAVIQPYVDEANTQYEDLGIQLGITDPVNLIYPIPIVSMRYLEAYLVARFAESSIGVNNVEITENDMYVIMHKDFTKVSAEFRKQLTPELMRGVAQTRASRSISTGTLYRTK